MGRRLRPGRVLGLVAAAALTAGCSATPVPITSPDLDESDAGACRDFLDDVPAMLNDEDPREVAPDDALGAAYGDPSMVVTCGVEVPPDFDQFSSCEEANGVGWYVPLEQLEDQDSDVTLSAVGYRPLVRLDLPAEYRPEGAAAAIAELAPAVKANLELVNDCS